MGPKVIYVCITPIKALPYKNIVFKEFPIKKCSHDTHVSIIYKIDCLNITEILLTLVLIKEYLIGYMHKSVNCTKTVQKFQIFLII